MTTKIVYKYSGWDKFCKDALQRRYFWFSKPSNFNDPFDCNMESLLAFDAAKHIFRYVGMVLNASTEESYHYIKNKADNLGILCVTSSTEIGQIGDKGYNNLHFWSHYACYHKGVALGFDSLKLQEYCHDVLTGNAFLKPVKYRDKPLELFEKVDLRDESRVITKPIRGIFGGKVNPKEVDLFFEQLFFHKDKRVWGLENESRIILGELAITNLRNLYPVGNEGYTIFDNEEYGYKIPYPVGEVLKEVTFGAKFCKDDIKEAIFSISRHHQNVEFYKASLDYNDADVIRKRVNL